MRIITDKLVSLFEIAGTTERLMPGVKKPKATEMYDILEMSYDRKDDGYWKSEGKLKLRANSKQITCWEMAIDLLGKIPELEDRRLIWARAMRYSWVILGKRFGCHRVTIKKRYRAAILDLEISLDKQTVDKIDNFL